MNLAETRTLLAMCAAYDNRTPSEAMLQAWTAALADTDYLAARDAVVAHYRDSRAWIMPADITARVKAARQDALMRTPVAELVAGENPDDARRMAQGIRAIGEAMRVPGEPAKRPDSTRNLARRQFPVPGEVLRVRCPVEECRARPGYPCTTANGRRVTKNGHPGRWEAAGVEFVPNIPTEESA